MPISYLAKQKKADLQELAKAADIDGGSEMLKDDLVAAIDDKLIANQSIYGNNPIFSDFYKRGGSPVKKERVTSTSVPLADGEGKTVRRRRQTLKVKDELEPASDDTPTEAITALAARTPRALQRVAERVPLPPSPQVVAEYVARQQASLSSKVSSVYKTSGTTELIDGVRENASTVVGIEILTLAIEYAGLVKETVPMRYAFDIPAIKVLNTQSYAVKLPDFFVLVTSFFWSPTTLWLATSLLAPILFAYFFNFSYSIRGQGAKTRSSQTVYNFDPLSYNVSKALLAWLVYAQGFSYGGFFSDATIERVNGALPGGYGGVLIGTGIGALASLYEAILQKH